MGTIFLRGDSTSENQYMEYTDHSGERIKRSTRPRSRRTAEQILVKAELDVAKRIVGLIDLGAERFAEMQGAPLLSHISP